MEHVHKECCFVLDFHRYNFFIECFSCWPLCAFLFIFICLWLSILVLSKVLITCSLVCYLNERNLEFVTIFIARSFSWRFRRSAPRHVRQRRNWITHGWRVSMSGPADNIHHSSTERIFNLKKTSGKMSLVVFLAKAQVTVKLQENQSLRGCHFHHFVSFVWWCPIQISLGKDDVVNDASIPV